MALIGGSRFRRILRCPAAALVLGAAPALAQAPAATPAVVDRREVIVPAPGSERVSIENFLGRVQVRGWDRPGEIHVVAEKHGPSHEVVDRLRVHYAFSRDGGVQIDARVEVEGRDRSLPLSGAGVDLLVEMPPELELQARTFGGDLSASGLRAGARLETTGGRIGVSNLRGRVVTRQLQGGQTVVAVDGDVEIDGIEGDLSLRELGGGHVDARVVDGNIRAERIGSSWVRLTSTTGEVILVGMLRPGARYELRSYTGNVRLLPETSPASFELHARSAMPLDSAVALRRVARRGGLVTAFFGGGRGRESGRALVELTSALGRISIQPR